MQKKMIVRISVIAAVAVLVAGVVVLKTREKTAAAVVSPATESSPAAPAEKPAPDITARTATALLDGPLALTGAFDLDAYRSSGVPVVIDFGADSCIPCKEMAPVLVELHAELKGKAIIRFVDVWKYRELAAGIPLQVIPTQVFFDADGKPFIPPESLGLPFTMYNTRDTNEHVFTTHEGGLSKEQLAAILAAMGAGK